MFRKFYLYLVVCVLAGFACKKQNNDITESLTVIGFHPCTLSAPFKKGYVVKLNSTGDTVITFNLPQQIREKIDDSVDELIRGYLLPADKVFRFNSPYRIARAEEIVVPLCYANIDVSEISKIKEQIIFLDPQK